MKTLVFCTIVFWCCSSFAEQPATGNSKRSRSINFEDELIEGINRKPLDSVNQLSEFEANRLRHLYSKRAGFVDRNRVLWEEIKLKH